MENSEFGCKRRQMCWSLEWNMANYQQLYYVTW